MAPERLGRAFGVFGVTQTLGLTLGPLVAGFLQVHAGWQWFFVAQAVFAVASAVGFLALFRGERGPARGAGPGILAVAWSALAERSVILLSVAAALLFLSMMGTYTYLAAWLRDTQGVAEDRVGIVLGVAGATLVYAQLLRRSPHPAETFRKLAVVVLLLSIIPDVGLLLTQALPGINLATFVALVLMHVATALISIRVLSGCPHVPWR